MGRELRFDDASLSGAAQHLRETVRAMQWHTDSLLATVRGTGTSVWGGGDLGQAMDELSDLLDEACRHLRGNIDLTCTGVDDMVRELRLTEAATAAGARALGSPEDIREV
ncbi:MULTISPECIES: hypothetical protein [unclassified Nonomuraea]